MAAQKARVESMRLRRIEAGKAQNIPLFKKLQRVQEKEMEKLAGFEQRGDETLTAKLKNGQIFFQLNKLDEARVLLSCIEPLPRRLPRSRKRRSTSSPCPMRCSRSWIRRRSATRHSRRPTKATRSRRICSS